MPNLTNQEIFTKVWNHFVIEEQPFSIDHDRELAYDTHEDDQNRCAYRGPGGTKCAVGLFITDENYSPSIEGFFVSTLFEDGYLSGIGEESLHLLRRLQVVHDDSAKRSSREMFERRMRLVAADPEYLVAVPS